MIKIKRPKKWIIEIWEKKGKWHERYIELFNDTDENRKAIKPSIDIISSLLGKTNFIDFEIKEIIMEKMVGIRIDIIANNLASITNQLLSEFILISELGDITLRDFFILAIQSFMNKDENNAREAFLTELERIKDGWIENRKTI